MPNWTTNQFVNSLLVGSRATNPTINYFLSDSGGAWSAQEAASFAAAAQSWMNVANLTFAQVGSAATAHFVENLSTTAALGAGTLADHTVPADAYASTTIVDVDIATNDPLVGRFAVDAEGWDNGGLTVGGDAHLTLIHEIGHGLGLDHSHSGGGGDPHVFPGVAGEQSAGTNNLNDVLHTVMSYRKGPDIRDNTMVPNDNNFGNAGTPMAFDIAAIQFLYGVNANFANGNDTYILPDAAAAGTFWTSIWDTGGTDAITYAGTRNATIDLRSATLQNEVGGGGFASKATGIFGGYTIAADFTNALADVNGETGVIIENASGGSGNDTIVGNNVNNILMGNGGNDSINGGSGNDNLIGGVGADSLNGGAGMDQAGYDSAAAAVRADLLLAATNTGDAAGDTYTSVEHLRGTNFNDVLLGSNVGNDIFGHIGNDKLIGRGGNDRLFGGTGNDILVGGLGGDVLNGGPGSDAASYEFATTSIRADLLVPGANTGEAAGDSYASIEHLWGSSNADTLLGDNNANDIFGFAGNDRLLGRDGNDRLFGGTSNDVLIGGTGGDFLSGGAGVDTASYEQATADVRADLFFYGQNMGEAGGDTYGDVESLTGSISNDVLLGNAGNNTLSSLGGNDRLFGRGGSDTVFGGIGADRLAGGFGGPTAADGSADTFLYTDINQSTVGLLGRDTIVDFTRTEGDRINLSAIDANAGLAGDQAFAFIGNAVFNGTAGQLRYDLPSRQVQADVNGNAAADFAIVVDIVANMMVGDFDL